MPMVTWAGSIGLVTIDVSLVTEVGVPTGEAAAGFAPFDLGACSSVLLRAPKTPPTACPAPLAPAAAPVEAPAATADSTTACPHEMAVQAVQTKTNPRDFI